MGLLMWVGCEGKGEMMDDAQGLTWATDAGDFYSDKKCKDRRRWERGESYQELYIGILIGDSC